MKAYRKILALLLATIMLMSCAAMTANASGTPKTLTYGFDADIDDFNPFTQQMTNYITLMVFNCYEPLLHLNNEMKYEMDLATEYTQVDEKTYVFKLREGVKFHNGEEFSADDVVWTINEILKPENNAWRAPQYVALESIEATGKYEVTMKLKTPFPALLDNIAYTPIMCKSTDLATLSTKVNGTGPFKFISWTPNDSTKFEKFADYWDADAVKVDSLVVKPFTDYSVAITNLETGNLQLLNRISVDNASSIENKTGIKVLPALSSNTVDLFEVGRHNYEPFQDPNVMQAIFLALDRSLINDSIFAGLGKPMTSIYPSGAKYHIDADTEGYNLEKAKELLDKAGYPNGFSFDLEILAGFPTAEQAAIIWQADLAKIGVTLNVKIEEMSVWLEAYLNRTYQMIWNQYGMVGSDPATFNSIILEQLSQYQTKDLNELNDLIAKGKSLGDGDERSEIYAEIQKLTALYRPIVPYIEIPILYGAVDSLEGIDFNGMGHVFLKNVDF
jgi:peptide/nickel transport system substrate-binding protein